MSIKFFGLKTNLVYSNDINGTLGFIGSSILMRKILSYMENIINNNNESPKLVLLASHDTAIANMEGLLNNLFYTQVIPPSYSSCFIFELTKNEENNKYYVNLIFNNKTLKTIEYNIFKNKIKDESWTYEKTGKYCGFIKEEDLKPNTNESKKKNNWIMIIIIFSLVNILFIGFISYLLISKGIFQTKNSIIKEIIKVK